MSLFYQLLVDVINQQKHNFLDTDCVTLEEFVFFFFLKLLFVFTYVIPTPQPCLWAC